MEKLTLQDLQHICTNPRNDHPARRVPEQLYRGEQPSGITTSHWVEDGESMRPVSRRVKFPVEHNNGRPIRCPHKAARKEKEQMDAYIEQLAGQAGVGPGEEFEITLGGDQPDFYGAGESEAA